MASVNKQRRLRYNTLPPGIQKISNNRNKGNSILRKWKDLANFYATGTEGFNRAFGITISMGNSIYTQLIQAKTLGVRYVSIYSSYLPFLWHLFKTIGRKIENALRPLMKVIFSGSKFILNTVYNAIKNLMTPWGIFNYGIKSFILFILMHELLLSEDQATASKEMAERWFALDVMLGIHWIKIITYCIMTKINGKLLMTYASLVFMLRLFPLAFLKPIGQDISMNLLFNLFDKSWAAKHLLIHHLARVLHIVTLKAVLKQSLEIALKYLFVKLGLASREITEITLEEC